MNDDKLSFVLHEMVCLMDALADRHLKKHHNISFKKFLVLAILHSCQPATQAKLAAALGYSPAAVSRSLSILEQEGYVQILDDPKHGRRNRVTLTIAGDKLVRVCGTELDELFHMIIGRSSPQMEAFAQEALSLRNKLRIEINQEG